MKKGLCGFALLAIVGITAGCANQGEPDSGTGGMQSDSPIGQDRVSSQPEDSVTSPGDAQPGDTMSPPTGKTSQNGM